MNQTKHRACSPIFFCAKLQPWKRPDTAADLMVLPSEYERLGVVVTEASCCGCPVAAGDRVGVAADLIAPVNPDFVFPCGDVPALRGCCKEHFPVELNWPGADGTHFEGCSLGPTRRISAELWKPWSGLF